MAKRKHGNEAEKGGYIARQVRRMNKGMWVNEGKRTGFCILLLNLMSLRSIAQSVGYVS